MSSARSLFVLLLAVGCSSQRTNRPATAPQRPVDTRIIDEIFRTRHYSLGMPRHMRPSPDGKAVLFLRSDPTTPRMSLFELDVATGKTRELLTPDRLLAGAGEKLSPEERARRERMRVRTRGFAGFQLSRDGRQVLVGLSGKLYLLDRASGKVRKLPTGVGAPYDPKLSPDGRKLAWVHDFDLYVLDLTTMARRRLTRGGTEDVSHGVAEFVAQEEMGRFTGYWWSPDSRWLAYEEADARQVPIWYVHDPYRPTQKPRRQRFPVAGGKNVAVRVGLVPVAGGATRWLRWDRRRYPYLAQVDWRRGGPLTLVVQGRRQKTLAVVAADPRSGATRVLHTESDPAWLNLFRGMPRWLGDGRGFLWVSERGGGPQLELRDARGGLVRVLVPPGVGFVNVASVDLKGGRVYFHGGSDPTQLHLFEVLLAGGSPRQLTHEPGEHLARFAKNHAIQVRSFDGPRESGRFTVHDVRGKVVTTLPSVAKRPPHPPRTTLLKVGAAPGFYCTISRPRTFDRGRRYPVVVYVYGGPGEQLVRANRLTWLRREWLADQGFIVVAMDGRGTPRRGRAWERAISGSFGRVILDDQVAALRALGARFPEMDLGRVGIYGWSFGGYVASMAAMRRPDVFKAAVGGAFAAEFSDYDTHYTERYLGLPQENPRGYRESSLLTYAKELRRPLMLFHGTADDNAYFLGTLKLSRALLLAGRDHRVYPLGGVTHLMADARIRMRVYELLARFFRKHLAR